MHIEIVKYLLIKSINIKSQIIYDWNPLIKAIENNCIELLIIWIDFGININLCLKNSNTALYIAIKLHNIEFATYLLIHSADPNIGSPICMYSNNIEEIILLIKYKANVNILNNNNLSAFFIACINSNYTIAIYLLQNGANINQINKTNETCLSIEISYPKPNINIINFLLKYKANINYKNENGISIFHIACKQGKINIIKKLIDYSINIYEKDNNGYNVIYYACLSKDMIIVDYLLTNYPTLDMNGYYQSIGAVNSENIEIMNYIFTKEYIKKNIIIIINELFTIAFKISSLIVIKYFIELGYTIDYTGTFCDTPLHLICENNSIEILNYLILMKINKCDFFKINSNYETPLDIAMNNNTSIELKELLCTILFDTILSNKLINQYSISNNNNNESKLFFRYNILLNNTIKLYYEIIIDTDGDMRFGCCSDSRDYLCINGNRQRIKNEAHFVTIEDITIIPKWKIGTIISIQIDMNKNQIDFLFNGELIEVSQSYTSFSHCYNVMPGFKLGSNQKCRINFGQTKFEYPIPEGYTSVYDYNNSINNNNSNNSNNNNNNSEKKNTINSMNLQVYDRIKRHWIYPLNYLTHNYNGIIKLVYSDSNAKLLSIMLEKYSSHVAEIAYMIDNDNRTILSMSSNECKKIFQKYLFFMSQYDFINIRSEHKSLTCAVYIAIDDNTKNNVAIKLMRDKDCYLRELASREGLDGKYIISAIQSYDGDNDISFKSELVRKGYSEYNYCIIMPAAERNLHRIISQEQIAGKEWKLIQHICIEIVGCLSHLHSKGVIHGKLVRSYFKFTYFNVLNR